MKNKVVKFDAVVFGNVNKNKDPEWHFNTGLVG